DAAVAATFLARARAGEAINDLLREAGMPGRRAYRRWQATQAPFAEAVLALRQRRDREIGRHGRARLRTWDPRLAEAILTAVSGGATLEAALAADPALPCRPTVRRWRREQPEFDRMLRMIFAQWRARRYAARGCTPELAEAILGRIVEGASFASLGREPAMPSRQTLRQWVRVRRDFAAEVARACELREEWLHDEVVHIALRMPPGSVTAGKRAIGPLLRQMVRLRHRPGAVHRKRPAPATARLACS
ncbi:MAG: hypothetical protein JWQ29_897, partial [Phenylobacterium sp.]|nr:hypothetical protein [Phenylobacterium sp.]